MDESKQVYDMCFFQNDANFYVLKAYLEEHPEVKVDLFKDRDGLTSLHVASYRASAKSTELLLDYKADINVRTNSLRTPLIMTHVTRGYMGNEDTALLLLERGADIHLKDIWNYDALYSCLICNRLSMTFPVLCYGYNVREFNTDTRVNRTKLNACIAEYTNTHAFIDAYQASLMHILCTETPVDTRMGLHENGIYHEPLERVLEYCGLSMHADQVVNDSIDRKTRHRTVKRTLIPNQARNAKYWYDLSKKN
jgi:hypothetical protein